MNMVWHNFHALYYKTFFISDFVKYFFKADFDFIHKNFLTVFYTPNELIIHIIDGGASICELLICHNANSILYK